MAITADQVRAAFTQQSLGVPQQTAFGGALQGAQTGIQLGQQVQGFQQQQAQQEALAQQQAMQQAQLRNQGAFLANQQLLTGITPDMTDDEIRQQAQLNFRSITPDVMAQFGLSEQDFQDDANRLQTNPQEFVRNIQSEIQLGQRQFGPKEDPAIRGEIRKETRSNIRKNLGEISKASSVVKDNFGKLQNLVGQIKKGNRSAVGQALVAIAKLGDPASVVSRAEADAIQNAESPVAAAIALFSSKGDENSARLMQALERSFDPQNPDLIDTDALLATGQALVSSAVPSIQSRFSESQEQAQNLTPAGVRSLFTEGLTNRVNDLSSLLQQAQPTQTEQDLKNIEDLF